MRHLFRMRDCQRPSTDGNTYSTGARTFFRQCIQDSVASDVLILESWPGKTVRDPPRLPPPSSASSDLWINLNSYVERFSGALSMRVCTAGRWKVGGRSRPPVTVHLLSSAPRFDSAQPRVTTCRCESSGAPPEGDGGDELERSEAGEITNSEKDLLQHRLADSVLYESRDPESIGAEYGQVRGVPGPPGCKRTVDPRQCGAPDVLVCNGTPEHCWHVMCSQVAAHLSACALCSDVATC